MGESSQIFLDSGKYDLKLRVLVFLSHFDSVSFFVVCKYLVFIKSFEPGPGSYCDLSMPLLPRVHPKVAAFSELLK